MTKSKTQNQTVHQIKKDTEIRGEKRENRDFFIAVDPYLWKRKNNDDEEEHS